MNARGVFSRPTATSSFWTSLPSRCQRPSVSKASGSREGFNPGKSHDACASRHEVWVIGRAGRRRGGVVYRDRTAQRDARVEVDACQYLVEDGAANVVEEDVDPIGTKRRES